MGLSKKMVGSIRKSGGEVKIGEEVGKIVVGGDLIRSVKTGDGERKLGSSDVLISTMHLADLVTALSPIPPRRVVTAALGLKYRSLVVVYLVLKRKRVTRKSFIFFPEKKYVFQRVSEQGAFSLKMVPKRRSILMAEVATDGLVKIDQKKLVARVVGDLEECGMIRGSDVVDSFVVIKERTYPLYDLSYKRNLKVVFAYLSKIKNLYSIGRQGLFLYTNIDHSLDMGFRLADFLDRGIDRKRWRKELDSFLNYKIVD